MENLKAHIGKKYNYLSNNLEIRNIKIIQGKYVILTDIKTFVFHEFDITNFFKDLKPYKEPKKFKPMLDNKTDLIKKDVTEDKDDIKSILFDAINRVKDNKEYVAQANAICNITSQLISIKKLEILNKK